MFSTRVWIHLNQVIIFTRLQKFKQAFVKNLDENNEFYLLVIQKQNNLKQINLFSTNKMHISILLSFIFLITGDFYPSPPIPACL